jgi:hypothetical protein
MSVRGEQALACTSLAQTHNTFPPVQLNAKAQGSSRFKQDGPHLREVSAALECMRASGARCRAAALPSPRNGTIPLQREDLKTDRI